MVDPHGEFDFWLDAFSTILEPLCGKVNVRIILVFSSIVFCFGALHLEPGKADFYRGFGFFKISVPLKSKKNRT
jgi:hypothetical protein